MDIKYTFRDLIVYLLTGFFCAFMINLANPYAFNKLLQFDYIKDKEILILVIAIPTLYIFGHMIQILDLIFSFYIVNVIKKCKEGNVVRRVIYKVFYSVFANTTAEYHRQKIGISEEMHVLQKFAVMVHDKNNDAEYYYLMKELFSGMKSFLFVYLLYLIYIKNWELIIIAVALLALVWLKAFNSSNNYAWSLNNTFMALKEKEKGALLKERETKL